jgi:hypothetical protein
MDRPIVYAGELPRSADFLGFAKSALYGLGGLAQAVLGASTCVSGLPCAPTSPASLQVTVGQGSIYEQETVDATAYGVLGTDTNTIVKQGLLNSPATLTITPPSTSGYSQVFLVEAIYSDVDSGTTVLPYYNSANVAQPLSGPNNSGTSQFTVRGGICTIALKAGTAAPTGSQTAPSPDSGYVALYYILVANGQSTITSANITVASGAPFIPLTLPQVPLAIQEQAGNYAADTGTANALAIALPSTTPNPPPAGMPVRFKKSASPNTTSSTIAINGNSPINILWGDGSSVIGGDLPGSSYCETVSDGTNLRLIGPPGPTVFARGAAPGVMAGLLPTFGTLTNTGATISVSVGAAADTTYARLMTLASTANWAVSNGNAINGYAGGTTLPNSSTIHFFLCQGATGVGVFASTTLAPALSAFPTGYNLYYRRIFSAITNSSGSLIPYTAREVEGGAVFCTYQTQILDLSSVTPTTVSRTLYTLSVPLGLIVDWQGLGAPGPGGPSAITIYMSSPDEPDTAVASGGTGTGGFTGETAYNAGQASDTYYYEAMFRQMLTNTSAQIGMRCETGVTGEINVYTIGFKDFRRN